jgi:hypothetical protein
MAKQVLSQRDLKHNQQSPFQQRVCCYWRQLTVFIVVPESGVKKTLNTDDVVGGGATTAAH